MGELNNMEVDFTDTDDKVIVQNKSESTNKRMGKKASTSEKEQDKVLINCLKNEKILVKFILKPTGLVQDPKHILYGGLGENSKRRFVVPLLQSGVYKNVLTNSEKDYLEYVMGLSENALSVYKKEDNFWSNRGVVLGKETTILDLSIPDDYIKYKILLANPDFIAASEDDYNNRRKATHQWIIYKENEDLDRSVTKLTITTKAYTLFGELKNDLKKLALIIEQCTGKTISKIEANYVYAHIESLIKDWPEKFVKAVEDEYLDMKILIKEAVDQGYIRKRGAFYYLAETNAPLCTDKQEPTLLSACQYLSAPKYQELLFTLQSKVNG